MLTARVGVRAQYLKTSRPTAVNLFNECDRLIAFLSSLATTAADGDALLTAYVAEAEKTLAKDIEDNLAIGRHGADAVRRTAPHSPRRRSAC